jgi:hypothetical protein
MLILQLLRLYKVTYCHSQDMPPLKLQHRPWTKPLAAERIILCCCANNGDHLVQNLNSDYPMANAMLMYMCNDAGASNGSR